MMLLRFIDEALWFESDLRCHESFSSGKIRLSVVIRESQLRVIKPCLMTMLD